MILTARGNSLEAGHFDALGDTDANRRVRRSMTAPSFPTRTRFSRTISDKKFRVSGDSPRFLQASDSDSLVIGPHDNTDPRACFKIHYFDVLSVPGNVVVLESTSQRYITKDSDNSMKLKAGNDPQQTNQTDDRFFIVHMDQGDNSIYLKQLHSGNYLSASSSGASLVPSRSEATSFKQFDCNGN
ncbi:uncharacterized protein LOC135103539 [Scylla paramamosain]|uniref:uncharacterized protein LOC135103539 n=1 Tax=Scylla paramamosain TaxID=85552 RepID=UPI003082BD70